MILGGTFHWRYLVLRSIAQYRYLILGGTWYNSVQGSGPVSGRGAPPCVEPSPHIHFQPFSLVFNLSSTAVLFVGNLLPLVHKRSLLPLVNVTGRELLCVGPIIMIMAGRKIEGCCPRAALHWWDFETPSATDPALALAQSCNNTNYGRCVFQFPYFRNTPQESFSSLWHWINVDDIWLADDLRVNKSSQ